MMDEEPDNFGPLMQKVLGNNKAGGKDE